MMAAGLDLLFLVGLAAWGGAVGTRILGLIGAEPRDRVEVLGVAVPLGLGGLALGMLGLGQVGGLGLGGIVGLLAVGVLVGDWWGVAREWGDQDGGARGAKRDVLDWVFDVALVATLVGTLLTALAPVTDGDALCYHLQVPKLFLMSGWMGFEPDLHETVYPLVAELLDGVALAVRGPVACRLISWLLGVSLWGAVTCLARPLLGARGRWAGTLTLLVPAVSNGMSAPLNDVSVAAFGVAGLVLWGRWLDERRWGLLAGAAILTGLAAGVKYPALVWMGLLGFATCGAALGAGGRVKGAMKAGAWFGVIAIVVAAPWYLRAFLYTGNPVYPFFRATFGGAGIDEVLDPIKRPLEVTVWNVLTALGPMTLEPDRFDSFAHQFGPLFLLFLPPLLLLKPPKRVLVWVGLALAFLWVCLTQRQSMRFLLLAVGPMSVGVAWVAAYWWRERSRGVCGGLVALALGLVLVFEAGLAVGRARHGLGVITGRETAGEYLARREPTYTVGKWVGTHLPADARLIGQDHRGFYFPRPYTMELAHRRRTGIAGVGASGEEVVATLTESGFTHLIMCPPEPVDAVEFDPTLGERLGEWLAEREPLYAERLTDGDGVVRNYRIYELESSVEAEARLAGVPETGGGGVAR